MRKGWNGDRDVAKWVEAHPAQAIKLATVSPGLRTQPSEKFPRKYQYSNPESNFGKGVHAERQSSVRKLPSQSIDRLLLEWMKMRGLWTAMLLYRSDEENNSTHYIL